MVTWQIFICLSFYASNTVDFFVLSFKGLLYFAGHGYENFGNSFMVPIDAPASYTSEHCLCVQNILTRMQEKETGLNVFLLDMCRKRCERFFQINKLMYQPFLCHIQALFTWHPPHHPRLPTHPIPDRRHRNRHRPWASADYFSTFSAGWRTTDPRRHWVRSLHLTGWIQGRSGRWFADWREAGNGHTGGGLWALMVWFPGIDKDVNI